MNGCSVKRVGFLLQAKGFIFIHLTLKKGLTMFITKYIPVVRFIIT